MTLCSFSLKVRIFNHLNIADLFLICTCLLQNETLKFECPTRKLSYLDFIASTIARLKTYELHHTLSRCNEFFLKQSKPIKTSFMVTQLKTYTFLQR